MNNYNKTNTAREIEIREVFNVLIKKKWWALGIFIFVVLIGFIFIFFRAPLYSTSSKVYIIPASVTGYEKLAEYFPKQYNELFSLVPDLLLEDLKSEDFSKLLKSHSGIDIKDADLKDRLYLYIDRGMLILSYLDNDPDSTFMIHKSIIELFVDRNNTNLLSAYNDLIRSINYKLEELKNNNTKLGQESYYTLTESKKVLTENKDFFTNRYTITNAPDPSNVYSYYNKKRDLAFVVFFAIALALIGTYMINYIQGLRKKD